MRPSRVVATVAATSLLPVVAALGGSLTGAAQALPTTTLTEVIDVPDVADTFRAELGPGRSTLAVSWSIPEASGSQGHREVWLRVRRDGVWTAPVMVSDPAVDSWEPQIAVDAGGTVEVGWREDLASDRLVIRAASAGGLGARRVLTVAPSEGWVLANGPTRTGVAWDKYDGTGKLRTYAVTDSGGGFGFTSEVSSSSWTGDARVVDASIDAGFHVLMARTFSTGDRAAMWALQDTDGTWTRTMVPSSYLGTSSQAWPHVAADASTGNALIVHNDIDDDGTHDRVTGVEADPLEVSTPAERMTPDLDLGVGNGLAVRDAIVAGDDLVAVLGRGIARATVGQGSITAPLTTPTSPACSNGAFSLREDLSFVCLTRSDPAGAWVDVSLDAGNTVVGRITPGPGMTKVSVTPVNVTTPVFLVAEVNSPNPTAKSLLVLAPDAPPPPTPTDPVSPAPTPVPPAPTTPTTPTTPATPTTSTFERLTKPSIAGRLRVGKALRARPGTWTPEPVTVRHQWFAGARKIRKATRARLLLTPAMEGKRISVRITLSRPGTTTVVVKVTKPGRVR